MIPTRLWIRKAPRVRGTFSRWTGKRLFSLNANNDYVVSEEDYEAFMRRSGKDVQERTMKIGIRRAHEEMAVRQLRWAKRKHLTVSKRKIYEYLISAREIRGETDKKRLRRTVANRGTP